jgi:thiamine monophosphate kinase
MFVMAGGTTWRKRRSGAKPHADEWISGEEGDSHRCSEAIEQALPIIPEDEEIPRAGRPQPNTHAKDVHNAFL